MEPLDPLWTGLLEQLSRVITPVWGDLIQYIPLLLILAIVGVLALVAWLWQRNAAANRSRVPRPLPSGRKPEGLHLPGPSPWPFVAPVGLALMLFAFAMGLDSLANLLLLLVGAAIGVIGALGWLLDARREYQVVETGAHAGVGHALAGGPGVAAVGPGAPEAPREIPAGIHLPGPSAWPFLAPIGLAVALLGLVLGPALLVAGLVMAGIAAIGWLVDATREFRQVEAVGHAEPRTRDPEEAFPKALGPLYVAVAGAAVVITLLPALFGLLPGGAADGPGIDFTPGTPEAPRVIALELTVTLQIADATGEQVSEITVAAGETIRFDVTNTANFAHNFYIGPAEVLSQPDATTPDGIPTWEVGPQALTWTVPPAGPLQFACTVPGHYQLMHGDFDIVP